MTDPITREQVERAIDAAYDCNAQGVNAALGAFWYEREDIPADVRDGWRQVGYLGLRIALTRWRDELTAAETPRKVARWDIGYVPTDRERYPERPAPRFKVGDRVTSGLGGPWKIGRVEWGRLVPEADCDEWVYHHASGNVSACESVLALAWTPTPASPPAPEVVDVPQPIVKRCGGVEAQWDLGEDHVTLVEPARGVGLPAPLALLRAMLAAIDAQQGGAS